MHSWSLMGFPDGILVVCCVLLGRSLTGFPDGTGIASCDCLMYIGDDPRIVIPEEKKPFSKVFDKKKKELLLSDYNSLETKKLYAAAQIAYEGAINQINQSLLNSTQLF